MLSGLHSALPQWQTGMDSEQLKQLLTLIAGWNNWVPISEFVTCLGIIFAVWSAKHAVTALKEGAKWLMELIPG